MFQNYSCYILHCRLARAKVSKIRFLAKGIAQTEIKVTRSPVVSTYCSENMAGSSVVYYIRLSNGAIITKPEDFHEDQKETESARSTSSTTTIVASCNN